MSLFSPQAGIKLHYRWMPRRSMTAFPVLRILLTPTQRTTTARSWWVAVCGKHVSASLYLYRWQCGDYDCLHSQITGTHIPSGDNGRMRSMFRYFLLVFSIWGQQLLMFLSSDRYLRLPLQQLYMQEWQERYIPARLYKQISDIIKS